MKNKSYFEYVKLIAKQFFLRWPLTSEELESLRSDVTDLGLIIIMLCARLIAIVIFPISILFFAWTAKNNDIKERQKFKENNKEWDDIEANDYRG